MRLLIGLLAAALAGCDGGSDPVKEIVQVKQAEARLEDLLRTVSTYHMPEFKGEGRLRDHGDTKCVMRRSRTGAVEGVEVVLVAVFAAPDQACLENGAVELSLWRKQTTPEQTPELLAQDQGPAGRFGFGHYLGPIRLVGGDIAVARKPNAHDAAARAKVVDDQLKSLVASPPFAARRLPPWLEIDLQPVLDPTLTFTPAVDRQTYEAVRNGGGMVMCWKAEETELRCVTEAPRRRPSVLALFSVHGFDDFRTGSEQAAIDLLLSPEATGATSRAIP